MFAVVKSAKGVTMSAFSYAFQSPAIIRPQRGVERTTRSRTRGDAAMGRLQGTETRYGDPEIFFPTRCLMVAETPKRPTDRKKRTGIVVAGRSTK